MKDQKVLPKRKRNTIVVDVRQISKDSVKTRAMSLGLDVSKYVRRLIERDLNGNA